MKEGRVRKRPPGTLPSSRSPFNSFHLDRLGKAGYLMYRIFALRPCFLKDGWNILDFVIVFASIVNFIPGVPNFSVVRGFRVLRPLRSISRLPNLRNIINALTSSLGELSNAMVLLLFILVCFSLFGMLSWSGLFHYRCRLTPFPIRMPPDCRSIADGCWNDFLAEKQSQR